MSIYAWENINIANFAKNLNDQMLKLNYKVPNGGTVIGYAGKLDDGGTGIFKTNEISSIMRTTMLS